MKTINYRELNNKTAKFYGSQNHVFKLGSMYFQAIKEDLDEGGSHLDYLEILENPRETFVDEGAEVKIIVEDQAGPFSGFMIVDIKNNHEYLKIGTEAEVDGTLNFVYKSHPKNKNNSTINFDRLND